MYKRINELLGTEFDSDQEINWSSISKKKFLKEEFIEEFQDLLDWRLISIHQILSEEFILNNLDRINWLNISTYQLLSWDFMMEFKDKLDWIRLVKCQPFLDPEYSIVKKYSILKEDNKLYNLYQQTKERGWFFGSIILLIKKGGGVFGLLDIYGNVCPFTKSMIYWKDIVKLNHTFVRNFKPVRRAKYV